ncbi:MAG: hypothetical protein JWM26_1632 [Betaproteobacteria bacterium]|nr:hypothetical protein [Betaproteobacteria bacterium]
MSLTDTAIRSNKGGTKPLKLFDGGGLFLPERRKMMQAWADHLDKLDRAAQVIRLGAEPGAGSPAERAVKLQQATDGHQP